MYVCMTAIWKLTRNLFILYMLLENWNINYYPSTDWGNFSKLRFEGKGKTVSRLGTFSVNYLDIGGKVVELT